MDELVPNVRFKVINPEQRRRDLATFRIMIGSCLVLNGIFSNTSRRSLSDKVYALLFVFGTILVFVSSVISLNRVPHYQARIGITFFCVIALYALSCYLFLQYNRQLLLNCFKLVTDTEYLSDLAFHESVKRCKRICQFLIPIFILNYASRLLLPFFKTLFIRHNFKDVGAYAVPYFFTCDFMKTGNGTDEHFLYWDPNNGVEYFIKNSLLIFLYLLIVSPFPANLTIFTFITVYAQVNVEIFKDKISQLCEDDINGEKIVEEASSKGYERASDESAVKRYKNLTEVMASYGKLMMMMRRIRDLLNFLSSYYLLCFYSLSICHWGLLLKNIRLITNFDYVVKFTSSISLLYLGFGACCHGGQLLRDMNSSLGDALYRSSWYEQSIEYQKMVYRFQLLLQKQFQIVSIYSIQVDLQMALLILARLYTAINVLLTIIKK